VKASPHRRDARATAFVFGIVTFFAAGLPLIDAYIAPRNSLVAAGSRTSLRLIDNSSAAVGAPPEVATIQVEFIPATGWEIDDDSNPTRSSLASDGVSFAIEIARRASGGPRCEAELADVETSLRSIDVSGSLRSPQSFASTAGELGLRASFVGARIEGIAFVFCPHGAVVSARAAGPPGSLHGDAANSVVAMAASVVFR
jgi:hypothetical protein